MSKEIFDCDKIKNVLSRKDFIKSSAFLGSSLILYSQIARTFTNIATASTESKGSYPLSKPENIIYSVCLQCHTDCPLKAKVIDGILVKIDGNPYSPQSMIEHIKYETSPIQASKIDGKLCPKGVAGLQSLYDPYRITKVLKRAGPRGSNKWKIISFEQAISEIIEGGYLFKDVKGEEKRYVVGLKDIYAVRDPKLMKELKEDAKKVASKKMSLSEFKRKHSKHLNKLIDPNHPDFGPLNNQFVFMAGRIEHGRKEFAKRWLKDAFGSVNWYEHTTICEQSHHIAYIAITDQYKDGKWKKGKEHMKPDALNSEFIIFFGTGAFEANFGPPSMAEKITKGIDEGRLKIAVVDPRFSKTAAKAKWWLPIKPGTDAALAYGMIRWIIENKKYSVNFLKNANKASAKLAGEPSFSTATWLVKISKDGRAERYLRAKDLNMGSEHQFVAYKNGKPVVFSPYDTKNPVEGELFVDTTINGIRVKSALQLIKEYAFSKSLDTWAKICGIDKKLIEDVSKEFTSHGKKAAAELYRGVVQHFNGFYNAQAVIYLNLLIGNPDWKGGLSKGGGHWHESGGKPNNPFNMKKLHPNKLSSFGIPLTREKTHYEKTTLFKGYPAKRQFFPFSSNVYQEILPSAKDKYPYPIKALLLHKGTPGFSIPGAQSQLNILTDLEAIPLFIACDIVIGESSMYADYIFPDLTVWERWGTPHVTPDVNTKTSKIRQPIVAPLTETVTVFGQKMPISMETIMLAIAEKLNLSGFGKNGFGPNQPLEKPEDFYIRMVANIAFGDKKGEEVPDADVNEMKLFYNARKHLPKTVFDPDRLKKAVGADKWKKVVYVLNRGGRFENFDKAYKGKYMHHQFKSLFNFFIEKVATTKDSITGKYFYGFPIYEELRAANGRSIKQNHYQFQVITYKEITGGQSRTIPDYWLVEDMPENYVLINSADAKKLGLKDGDKVKLVSESNKEGIWNLNNGTKILVAGKVKVTEGIRPGVVAVSWHYGHWAYGANNFIIDNKLIKGDSRRKSGICLNAVLLIDPYLKNSCISDPIGGSSSFYDTKVNLIKI